MAREFRYGKAEIGHVHLWGDVDIPFPRAVHDVLLTQGQAQRHRWLPDSGWITFHMHNGADLERATRLLRLSYLRYALKAASEPESTLREETQRLNLSTELAVLMAQCLPDKSRNIKAVAGVV